MNSGPCMPNVSGDVLTQMRTLISQMTPQQAQAAATVLNEQLGSQARGVPERFGQLPVHPDVRYGQFQPNVNAGVGIGAAESAVTARNPENRHVFSRADKWLGQPPESGADKWHTREAEISGFSDYVVALQSWAALASMTFAEEISVAARWPEVLWQQSFSEDQKVRSVRLFGILRTAFSGHARASLMVQAFSEGLPLDHSLTDPVRFLGNTTCGFELLRQLSQQFPLRSRAEALSMRSELLGRIFAMKSSESTSGTVVGDVIRKIDIEVSRFSKLLGTLPSNMDRQGLSIGDGDMLVILLRSLPEEAKKYVLHHSSADTYSVARMSALKFEQQQRLFLDLNLGGKKHGSEVFDLTATDDDDRYDQAWYDASWEQYGSVYAMPADRCEKCGRRHKTANCGIDMSKVKCYACGEHGHISANCKKKLSSYDSFQASGSQTPKGKGKPKGYGKDKGKGKTLGKGKGFQKGSKGSKGSKGKKGKMHELTGATQETQEGSTEDAWGESWWEGAWDESWDVAWESSSHNPEGAVDTEPQSLQLSAIVNLFPQDIMHEQRFEARQTCVDSCARQTCVDSCARQTCVDSCGRQTCLDSCDAPTCLSSSTDQLERQTCSPLLVNEIFGSVHDDAWWLIDSGAGVTVLSERSANFFGIDLERLSGAQVDQGFSAANGSAARMLEEVTVDIAVLLEDAQGRRSWQSASMNAWVGDTQHNILSTTMLCFRGWTFSQDRDGLTLLTPGGQFAPEVTLYGNVPWLRLRPGKRCGGPVLDSGSPVSSGVTTVSPITRSVATEIELAQHRLQGHTPYHPGCRHCQVSRSIHQHRKRGADRLESEVVADFFYLSSTGEDHRLVHRDNLKVLVLVERMSSMIGAVVVSDSIVHTRGEIIKWLREFGLTSGACSIRLVTDAESAVADLVGTSSGEFTFQVKRAEPQNHEAVGSAERGVRRLKESLQTLRSDLNQGGLDVCFSLSGFGVALTYVCFSLNKYSKAHGSELSPCDFVLGRPSPKGAFTLLGATVLAELPQSIRDLAPNIPRFAESAFLHPMFGSMAIKVRAVVRIEGQMVLKVFAATSVKPCVPLSWRLDLLDGVLNTLGGGPGPGMPHEERVARV